RADGSEVCSGESDMAAITRDPQRTGCGPKRDRGSKETIARDLKACLQAIPKKNPYDSCGEPAASDLDDVTGSAYLRIKIVNNRKRLSPGERTAPRPANDKQSQSGPSFKSAARGHKPPFISFS